MIVTLRRTPLRLWERAEDYHAELMRELALVAVGAGQRSGSDVPAKLLALIAELTARYSGAAASPDTQRDDAVNAGSASVDLVYDVPMAIGEDTAHLAGMLTEAQEYCARGEMITLCAPDDVVRFQSWYCGEFTRQVRGESAIPWPGDLA